MAAYSSTKLSVKDSYEDDEASDDVEDEVFIRDGRNGFRLDDEIGVKRPLMAPRRKCKTHNFHPELCKRPKFKKCAPYCYVIMAIAAFLGLVTVAIMILNYFPVPLEKLRRWTVGKGDDQITIVPCTEFSTESIWIRSFSNYKSEAPITIADLDLDSVQDFIIGYATGVEITMMPMSCISYPGSIDVCGGGAVALSGKTGAVLWQHWTRQDILYVDCGENVNSEITKDCLLSGKGGVLSTVDGRTGELIWELKSSAMQLIDVYSAQYIPDMDNDGCPDILAAHTSDETGHVLILNGRNSQQIGRIETPKQESILTVPRITTNQDGGYTVVFATGTLDSPGSIYAISLYKLASSNSGECVNIWNDHAGITSGIVLADMNSDGTEDIIFTSGDKLIVISGSDFSPLWNVTSPSNPTQILIGPTPAYFDDDTIPDLLVTDMVGPSFPTYYYSQTWVANGNNGHNLLDGPIIGAGEITAPGISISYSGIGNDMYLYWMATCNQPKLQSLPFSFTQGSKIQEQAHADLCKLRFNTTLEMKLYALNQHIEPPGILLYSSATNWEVEHNATEFMSPKTSTNEDWTVSRPSSFRHKIQQGSFHYKYPHMAEQDSSPIVNYPRFQHGHLQNHEWDSQPNSYGESMNGFPGVNVGEIPVDYSLYPQEPETDELPLNLGEGRDERANLQSKQKRNIRNDLSLTRATSTATLAESINGNGIDVIFATYWETPSSRVRILTEKDQECVQSKLAAAQSMKNKVNNFELEVLQERAEKSCLGQVEDTLPESVNIGQMTVYRINLMCKCSTLVPNKEECSVPIPLDQQSYSHRTGDVYFKKRPKL